ncbi:MAG: DEAD/DEAH box helicase family protein [Bacteroidetes bacterium]|nr:DEAD/DEAH box helicase family protein [Bacteroidota bacterium]
MIVGRPIINTPYRRPEWHRPRSTSSTSAKPLSGRYPATGLYPNISGLKLRNGKVILPGTNETYDDLTLVNDIRTEIGHWESSRYAGATRVTRELIGYWTEPPKAGLYFAQKEAILTTIWLLEIAPDSVVGKSILRELDSINAFLNDGIMRICHQMATGTGKTAVMAATILWQTCNHVANPADSRFTNRFLAIAPGITVRERLDTGLQALNDGVMNPNCEYYNPNLFLLPHTYEHVIQHVRVTVVNYHQFAAKDALATNNNLSEKGRILSGITPAMETDRDVVERILGSNPQPVIVFNDEAHHCHQGLPGVKADQSPAYIWCNALRLLKGQNLLHGPVRDFTATPFFIGGTRKANMFPWIVSQYELREAEESGIVKLMRLPREVNKNDDWDEDVARNIYAATRDEKSITREQDNICNRDLKRALSLVYNDYERLRANEYWSTQSIPPVVAVVVDKVGNANALFDYIAGFEMDGTLVGGRVGAEWSNVCMTNNKYHACPRTIVIHSNLDEPDREKPTKDWGERIKPLADAFRKQYPTYELAGGRFLVLGSDMDVMRAVLNTIGRAGLPGEHVRCVVSVSMLTEGWDARTITHIVGFRRFGTPLLCEQVSGRALRKLSYETNDDGYLYPEYADIIGIPFDHLRRRDPGESDLTEHVSPPYFDVVVHGDRSDLDIRWPNVVNYVRPKSARYLRLLPPNNWESVGQHTVETFDSARLMTARPRTIEGEETKHYTQPASQQEFEYLVAETLVRLLTEIDRVDESVRRSFLFMDAVARVRQAISLGKLVGPSATNNWPNRYMEPVEHVAHWLQEHTRLNCDVSLGIRATVGARTWFDTSRLNSYRSASKYKTDSRLVKTAIRPAVCDSWWEVEMAEILDNHPEIIRWIRNDRLGWVVPYVHDGMPRSYEPDFVAAAPLGSGHELVLVLEVKGQETRLDRIKKHWTEKYWIPAVNNHPEFSKNRTWTYLYVDDNPKRVAERRISDEIARFIQHNSP